MRQVALKMGGANMRLAAPCLALRSLCKESKYGTTRIRKWPLGGAVEVTENTEASKESMTFTRSHSH